MNELYDKRKEIDNLDKKMIEFIASRTELSQEIGRYKVQNEIPIYDADREESKLRRLEDEGERRGLSKEFIRQFFKIIFEYSREIQESGRR